MTNAAVKDAKDVYITTGRLNRNIISKEISISWYKCKLQNLNPKDSIRIVGEKPTINFDTKFLNYVDTIVPIYYDYILVNMSLQKCSSRIHLTNLGGMDTIDDLAIGTNGGYLTYKTQSNQLVSQDEHYLDCLSDKYSYGIMISHGEKMLGVLMLISKEKPNEYDIAKIREKLIQYYSKSEVTTSEIISSTVPEHNIRHFFAYPDSFMIEFEQGLNKIGNNTLPILIRGSQGSGKSTLARLISEKNNIIPYIISLNDTPRLLQKSYIENGLSHFETVIIESFEKADPETISLLTVYTEEILRGKYKDKVDNYKCSKLILTTAYGSKNQGEFTISSHQEKQLIKFIDRLKLNTVNLLNISDFIGQMNELVVAMLSKNGVSVTDAYKTKLIEYSRDRSFKSVQQIIELSIDEEQSVNPKILSNFPTSISETILDLEAYEKEYILNIYSLLDNNMTATASILNIGRSTLYRKLEKYQNDTHSK